MSPKRRTKPKPPECPHLMCTSPGCDCHCHAAPVIGGQAETAEHYERLDAGFDATSEATT